MINEGQAFPNFSLQDQDGVVRTLESFKGKPCVIYFYPKDDTSGCTQEACEFQLEVSNFQDSQIVGVSPDSVKSHRKFADKYGLTFTLLADVDVELSKAVGVWVEKSMYGKKYLGIERTTFILDANGIVTKVWNKVKPAGHASEVISKAQV